MNKILRNRLHQEMPPDTYNLIGRNIKLKKDDLSSEDIHTAIAHVRDTFNAMARKSTHVHCESGVIGAAWVLTLLKLTTEWLKLTEPQFESTDENIYSVNLSILGCQLYLRSSVTNEYIYRKAAKQIISRYGEVAKVIADEGMVWRYIALATALRRNEFDLL